MPKITNYDSKLDTWTIWEMTEGEPIFFINLLPTVEAAIQTEIEQDLHKTVHGSAINAYYRGASESMRKTKLLPDDVNVQVRVLPTLASMAISPDSFLFTFPDLKATQPEDCPGLSRTYVVIQERIAQNMIGILEKCSRLVAKVEVLNYYHYYEDDETA